MEFDETELARITPSPARRVFATAVLAFLGLLLVGMAVAQPPSSTVLLIILVGLGVFSMVVAVRLYAATRRSLILTAHGLSDSEGVDVARMDEVVGIDHGLLAAKPSNGFVLRLARRQPRAWAPGLWWRFGRKVGVGGTISGVEGRYMADRIAELIAHRGREG